MTITLPRIKMPAVIFGLLILVACRQQLSPPPLADIDVEIERLSGTFVPDKRVDVFSVETKADVDTVVLFGDVLRKEIPGALLDSLGRLFPGIAFRDSIRILPEKDLPASHGIIDISVANMRREPRFQAELVNQVLMGMTVRLLKEENGFYYVRNWDRYLGWINRGSLETVDSPAVYRWQNGLQVVAVANYGAVHEMPGTEEGPVITDLVPGNRLQLIATHENQYFVETPGGRRGYVDKEMMVPAKNLAQVAASRERIIGTSRKFLGIPYLWGGTSAKGFDCSGFVQTVFRMNNVGLPRDAGQMVHEGREIDAGRKFANVAPGDLLFFGSTPSRISHVAIYLGNQLYIHSSTFVQINSLNPEHPLYSEYRRKTLRKIKRILPEE